MLPALAPLARFKHVVLWGADGCVYRENKKKKGSLAIRHLRAYGRPPQQRTGWPQQQPDLQRVRQGTWRRMRRRSAQNRQSISPGGPAGRRSGMLGGLQSPSRRAGSNASQRFFFSHEAFRAFSAVPVQAAN